MESMSLLRHAKAQELPKFLVGKSKTLVGVQNNNGQNVFDLVPADGTIAPGGDVEITATFAPDHASDYFSDGIKIELFGKEECQSFQIKGTAKQRIMFLEGGDKIRPEVESLSVKPVFEDEEMKPAVTPMLVTLKAIAKDDVYQPASRDIHIGCVRTMAVSQKKNGEFTFENIQLLTAKGFNVDPAKGMVEAGVLKPVTFTWTPPAGHDPNEPMEASVIVTLKGDIAEQFKIMLHAMIVSE